MKRILLFALLALHLPAFAQKGFYVNPVIAVGASNTVLSTRLSTANTSVAAYQAGAYLGYQLNHIRVESGLQYFTAGAKLEGLLFENDFETYWGGGDVFVAKSYTNIRERESYLSIPVRIGYAMALGNKINLVPSAGIDIAYTLSNKYNAVQYSNEGKELNRYSNSYSHYDKVRTLAVLSVQAEYLLNRNIAITAKPAAKYFIRDIGTLGNYKPNLIMLEAGVLYRF